MAKNKFSKLMLNLDDMTGLIKLWCESNLDGSFNIEKNDLSQRCQFFIYNNGKRIELDFVKCSGGLFTIVYKVGSDPVVSESIAEYIFLQISNQLKSSPYANGFSTILPEDEVNAVVELLKSEGNVLSNYSYSSEPGKAAYRLYKFTGIKGDSVTLKYFLRTNRLQVQGKPHYLFQDVISLVTESSSDVDTVVDNQLVMCNLSVNKDAIFEEMKCVLGEDIFNYLPITHRAILASTFIQFKIDVPFPDYSCIIYPAYRAYEGFIRKVFKNNGLDCVGKVNIGEYFYIKDNTFIMRSEYSDKLSSETANVLTKLYAFYNQNRNPFGHASGDDFQTVIISDRSVAYNKFMEVINYIKKGYTVVV